MKFTLRWLRQYLQTEVPAPKVLEALTMCGLEVESVLDLGMISGNLVVGEILAIEPIAGAEKIRLTTIKADRETPLKIVCGAQNIQVGDKVPVAKFGMKFPDGFELKPRKIMGIDGEGMLCSAKELGIAEDADGIWLLPPEAPVGEPWDAVIEINVTPNRPDALSVVGVARDLAAKLTATKAGEAKLRQPDFHVDEENDRTEASTKVTVLAKEDCPRYTARIVRDVTVGPSPRWMQVILESCGLRPVNNIVDITNFVMLELGHPLHAFDLEHLSGAQIVVRLATPGETIETLDGQKAKLEPTDLLICDAQKPVAIAGIMGGANSEIGEHTKHVLLEAAYFRPATIRATRRRLGKSTDASYRFERGTDPKRLTSALNRAAQLLDQHAGGRTLRGVIDVVGSLELADPIVVRLAKLNRALGLELSGREVMEILTPLGFEVLRSDREEMQVAVPTFRPDVSIEADIVEEVARIVGYDRVPEIPLNVRSEYRPAAAIDEARRKLGQGAVGLGFCEAINFSFVSEGANAFVGAADEHQVKLVNPLLQEYGVMRRSMLPSLLQNVVHNLNHGVEEVALFELGATYAFADETVRTGHDLEPPAVETPYFAAVLAGSVQRNWREKEVEPDFFVVRGHVEQLLAGLGLTKLVVESAPNLGWLHPGRAARFLVKGQPVATFGEVHPALLKQLGIKVRVCYAEIPLTGPVVDRMAPEKHRDLPRFPAVGRDIALVVPKHVRSLEIERTIRKAGKDLVSSVRLFDVYEGERIEQGKKSLAYALTYRAADRTLKEAEVAEVHGAILEKLSTELSAVLRSS